MKNIKFIISFCLILILFFITSNFFESPKNIATFKRYSSPTYKINKSLIKTLDNDSDSKKQIIDLVLNIIKYNKWQDYKDYIDIEVYYGNVIPNLSEQLILTLNLSKDLGVIAIFEEINDNYIFHSKIDNLAPIKKLTFINHPTKHKDLMLVYQILNERLGALFYENFIQIYDYDDLNFNIVWEKVILREEIYKENWLNVNASDTEWTMIIEESQIDFDYKNPLKINTITSLKKYKAQSKIAPSKNDFFLTEEISHDKIYYWSEQYNMFVLGELTGDNEIIYLPKSKFNTLFENTFYSKNKEELF